MRYLHSDIDTLERIQILRDLRRGEFDVLVGINLLREGLDLPEVSLVAILDADKEGFLRSGGSLIQTVGRAARNVNGRAIMYADRDDRLDAARHRARPSGAAPSRKPTTASTASRRPRSSRASTRCMSSVYERDYVDRRRATRRDEFRTQAELDAHVATLQGQMKAAAANLEFEKAATLRDRISSCAAASSGLVEGRR